MEGWLIGGCEIGKDTILSSKDTGGAPEVAVFCDDSKFAVGRTTYVVVTFRDRGLARTRWLQIKKNKSKNPSAIISFTVTIVTMATSGLLNGNPSIQWYNEVFIFNKTRLS